MNYFNTYQPKVRMKAFKNAPLRSGEGYQIGFYDIGVMRELMDLSEDSDEFRIAMMPIPGDVYDRQKLYDIITHPSIQYALVDKRKVVACTIKGQTGWMSALNQAGYTVKGGGKTSKRAKSFHRASLINAHFDHLNIKWVEPTDYTRYDFVNGGWADWVKDPSTLERLLDGGFVISSRLIQQALDNFPVYHQEGQSLDNSDIYYDPEFRQKLLRYLSSSKVFNARLFTSEGLLKGNVFVSDNLPLDIDVVSSRTNLKKEITYSNGYRFLAEPQGPKSRVITDDQTVINLPKLFRKSDMEMWLKEEYEKMFQDAINGKLLANWSSIFVRQFSRENRETEDLEAQARLNYVGHRWVSMGLSITNSPWLFKTLAISHAMPLENRIPIPCSVYEQVIPESLAKMAGYDIQVEEGDIHRINDLGVHVVNDFDWLEMYESHGGHDQDDFFKLFYRKMEGGNQDGKKVVIVARSPNGYGEYSIFNYVEGQWYPWYPTWKKSDGTKVTFPSVNSRGWPKRLSQAIRLNEVRYVGLPSEYDPKPPRQVGENYSVEDVMHDVDIAMGGGNVGRYVNASMLHSSVIRKHRPVQVCSMESAIDGCTQTSDGRDREAIDAEAESIIQEVLDSGKAIDRDLWTGRFQSLAKKYPEVETYEGTLTHLNSLCVSYFNAYVQRVNKYAQEDIELSDSVRQISERLYYHAIPVLRQFRMGIYNANADDSVYSVGAIKRDKWDSLYNNIVEKILSYERIEDQHDFVISLYAASILIPTGNGSYSDQIVMNRVVYPYLEKALIHYGIGNRVAMTFANGKYTPVSTCYDQWTYTDPDGKTHVFDNRVDYQ